MEAAALPPGLQHLAPMSTEIVFLLGVTALMGTGNHDFMDLSMVKGLIRFYLPEWDEDVVETDYIHLIEHLVYRGVLKTVETVEMFDKPIVFIPTYDQAGFLNCLTFEQKSKLFYAAVYRLWFLFPGMQIGGSMYPEWPTCKKYVGHVRSLALHWDALDKCNETITVPAVFVPLMQHCAIYMRETNDRHNSILLTDIALRMIDRQKFTTDESSQNHLSMIKVELLTVKGSVSIQLREYTAAKEALKRSIKIYNRHNPIGDGLKTTTSQAYLASLAAAQGEYEESMSLFWKLWLLVSSSHFIDGVGGHARRILKIHVSILAAKVATLVGKYDEADDMLRFALAHFDETMDNPVFHRAILHASGNLHYAKGAMGAATDCFQVCVYSWRFGTVMHVNQVDEERTISIYHRLAVMDVEDDKARAARSKVKAALQLCRDTRSPYMLPWKGRLELAWAEILRKFHYFAGCWEREEKDLPEKHEDAARQVAAELGIVTVGLVTDEQFAKLLPWDIL